MGMGIKRGEGIYMDKAEKRALVKARDLCDYGQKISAAMDPEAKREVSRAWATAFESLDALCTEFPIEDTK